MRTLALVAILLAATTVSAEDFVVLFHTGPAWDSSKPPNEQNGFREHSANLRRLRSAGQITMGARYSNVGLIVLEAANEAAARAEFEKDPTLAAKVFTLELHPMRFFYEPVCPSAERNK
jgi:hypothetical protein